MSFDFTFSVLPAAVATSQVRPILGRHSSNTNHRQQICNQFSSSYDDFNSYSYASTVSSAHQQNQRRRIASTPASYFDYDPNFEYNNVLEKFRRLSLNDRESSTPISPNPWSPANFSGQKSPIDGHFVFTNESFHSASIVSNQDSSVVASSFYYCRREKRPYVVKKQDECVFCKNNNLSPAQYKGHLVKDPRTKRVTCPVLRNMPCKRCNASGDFAHTDRYCPAKPPIVRVFKVQK